MRKLLFGIVMLFSFTINAQYMDVGLLGGVSNYQGDLAPKTLWASVGQSHAVVGAFARYNFNNVLATKISFSHGTIEGADYLSNDASRQKRNLHFSSKITEVALRGEINLFGYTPSNLFSDFSPYIFGGVALFKFNPQTEYLERWVDLQPLGTEGQGMDGYAERYDLVQVAIPFGGGLKYNISEEWTLGLEIGLRKTFTDHLDDVSGHYVNYNELLLANGTEAASLADRTGEFFGTEPRLVESGTLIRGNAANKDWYLFANLTVSYNFVFKGIYTSSVTSRHLGCPKKF